MTDLILAIFTTNARLIREGDRISHDLGLTGVRWQVLHAVRDTPKTVAQIARNFESSRQGILWTVQTLTRHGLVKLITNPDHKRAKLVQLTEAGVAIYEETNRRQGEWVNAFARDFDMANLKIALKVIEQLGSVFEPTAE